MRALANRDTCGIRGIRGIRGMHGIALLEALLTAAVLGFGLLAVGRLQFALEANTDIARQRTEAVQLAEQKLEELRGFSTLTGYGGTATGIVTGSDTPEELPGRSASFARSWNVGNSPITLVGGSYPAYKAITVTVSWTGRGDTAESVRLASIIAMVDPASSGQVVVPPAGSPTRKPKNRSLSIPWPAVGLGDGTSAFHPPGTTQGGVAVIVDDATGAVTQTCANATLPSSDAADGTTVSTGGWGCTAVAGYLLGGYVGVSTSSLPNDFALRVQTAANTSPLSGTATFVACWDDHAAMQYTNPYFVSYACVVGTSGSNGAWSGTTVFTGYTTTTPPGWNPQYRMCRYFTAGTPNVYTNVTASLLNQNYVLVPPVTHGHTTNPGSCPVGTVQHQPTAT